MEYEISGWKGYYLYIKDTEIKVYSSWGFDKGKPVKGFPRKNSYLASKLVSVSKGKRKSHKDIIGVTKIQ